MERKVSVGVFLFLSITGLIILGILFSSPRTPSEKDMFVGQAIHSSYPQFSSSSAFTNLPAEVPFLSGDRQKIIPLTVYDDVIYRTAYVSINGTDWKEVNLTGNMVDYKWIRGTATGYIDIPRENIDMESGGENYFIFYSCSRNAGIWDCHGRRWQLEQFNITLSEASVRYIVQEGIGLADIIISPDAPNSVRIAADYFQTYIQNMTGAELPISNVTNQDLDFHVYIGRSKYTDALGVTSDGCVNGGFKMISGEDYLILLGDDQTQRIPGFGGIPGPRNDTSWDALVAAKWGENFRWDNDFIDYYGNSYHYELGIWENDRKGSLNAVYEFLYDQGIRWYHPGWYAYPGMGTVIPEKQDISFEDTDVLINPDFAMRSFALYGKGYGHLGSYHYDGRVAEEMQWRLSLRTNSFYEFIIGSLGGPGHGIRAVISRQSAEHPEYYAIDDGVRQIDVDYPQPNLCYPYYTAENRLFEETVKYVKTMYDVYNISIVSVMPNDGMGSISDECRERATYERGLNGMFSDYVWEFVNNVAWEIYEDPQYAGKMVFNSAYTPYLLPPNNLSRPIAPNLAVMLAKWRSDNADPSTKAYYDGLTDSWLELLASNNNLTGGVETNRFFSYDYYLHNAPYRTGMRSIPFYFPHIISEDLQSLKGKCSGEFIEINTLSGWPPYDFPTREWVLEWDAFASDSLNTYITARLYWDADQDVDALMEEYYILYYGPASAKMKELIEYSEANYADATNPMFMKTIRRLIGEALDMVEEDGEYAHRISLLSEMIYLDYSGDEVLIDSCQVLDSLGTTYRLTADVAAEGTCMTIDESGITLDCQGHTITYSTGGGSNDHAIYNNAFRTYRGDYFNISNCIIRDGSYLTGNTTGSAIYLDHADAGVLENNSINVSGLGIYTLNVAMNRYTGNNVAGLYQAFYTQINDGYVPSANVFLNNIFVSNQSSAVYLYKVTNETLVNNTFRSERNYGLYINNGWNMTLVNNTFYSGTTYGLNTYNVADLVDEGNTKINGG